MVLLSLIAACVKITTLLAQDITTLPAQKTVI